MMGACNNGSLVLLMTALIAVGCVNDSDKPNDSDVPDDSEAPSDSDTIVDTDEPVDSVDDSDTDAETDVDDSDTDSDGDTETPADTGDSDTDAPIGNPSCAPPPVGAVMPTVLWSGGGSGDYEVLTLEGTYGARGYHVFIDQADLDAFLAALDAPPLLADFSGSDVAALWYVTRNSCDTHVESLLAWHDGLGKTIFRMQVFDQSMSCCIACASFGEELEVVQFTKGASTADACLDFSGGCTPSDTGYCP